MVKKKRSVAKKVAVKSVPKPVPTNNHYVGRWALLVGFIIAIIVGFADLLPFVNDNLYVLQFLLIVVGVIIGFFNIHHHEFQPFLLAGVSLVIVSWLGLQTLMQIEIYGALLQALQTLFVPATAIVALRSLFYHSTK